VAFNVAAVVEEVVFVVATIEVVVALAVSEVEVVVVVDSEVAAAVDFEVVEAVATDIKKKRNCFSSCLLFVIFCMTILIIVVVFSIRYIHKTNNMKQKKNLFVFI
jgi:hypothetical protein